METPVVITPVETGDTDDEVFADELLPEELELELELPLFALPFPDDSESTAESVSVELLFLKTSIFLNFEIVNNT